MKKINIVLMMILVGVMIGLVWMSSSPTTTRINTSAPVAPVASVKPGDRMSMWGAVEPLIRNHPDASISRDLARLIDTRQVAINFDEDQQDYARVIWTNAGDRLVLSFDQGSFFDQSISSEFKQLIIYHEYQHILQELQYQRAGGYADGVVRKPVDEAFIRRKVEGEVEAYEAEAKLAARLGWEKHDAEICTIYRLKGRVGLYKMVVNDLAMVPEFRPHQALFQQIVVEQTR